MKFFSWVLLWMDRLCVLIGAFIGSQIPSFMQQYTQQLAGHMEEINHVMSQIQIMAQHAHKTTDEYIHKFIVSGDPDFINHGEFLRTLQLRLETFQHAFREITQASIWMRPYVFIKEIQYDLAQSTFKYFQSSITLNLEGFCYAFAGIILTLLTYKTILKCAQKMACMIKNIWTKIRLAPLNHA